MARETTTRCTLPPTNAADPEADATNAIEPLDDATTRRRFNDWPQELHEQAAALSFAGASQHEIARQLGVPRSTIRGWVVSDMPAAVELRDDLRRQLIHRAYDGAAALLEKVLACEVRNIRDGAVAYGIITERAALMEQKMVEQGKAAGLHRAAADLTEEYRDFIKASIRAEIEAEIAAERVPTLTATITATV